MNAEHRETLTELDGRCLVNSASSWHYWLDWTRITSAVECWLDEFTPDTSDRPGFDAWLDDWSWWIEHEITQLWTRAVDSAVVTASAARGVRVRPVGDDEAKRLFPGMTAISPVPRLVPGPEMEYGVESVREATLVVGWDHMDYLHRLDDEYQEFIAVLVVTHVLAVGGVR